MKSFSSGCCGSGGCEECPSKTEASTKEEEIKTDESPFKGYTNQCSSLGDLSKVLGELYM
jgi:hypothetical protein